MAFQASLDHSNTSAQTHTHTNIKNKEIANLVHTKNKIKKVVLKYITNLGRLRHEDNKSKDRKEEQSSKPGFSTQQTQTSFGHMRF